MRARARIRALLALGLAACAPADERPTQVLLFIDTDAIIDSATPSSDGAPKGLFDRLEVAAFEPGALEPCADCVRTFAPAAEDFAGGGVTVGLPVRAQTPGYRVRIRLYRAANSLDGLPREESSLTVVAALPPVDDGVKAERSVVLLTESVGTPAGSLDAPVDATKGHASASLVGTWAGAQRVQCAAPPNAGEVCVPGGAFWMGSPLVSAVSDSATRLVVLSPFYLDAYEVRVSEARVSKALQNDVLIHDDPRDTTGTIAQYCTYTKAPGSFEALPVNCVNEIQSAGYCAEHSKKLPTEAQLEYVQGALVSSPFPWGFDLPSCQDAVWGRAGEGGTQVCPKKNPSLPSVGGSGTRDRLDFANGTLFDLAGNLAEWTGDRWNRSTEPCWDKRGVFVDPTCANPKTADLDASKGEPLYVVRGGSWTESVPEMRSAKRLFYPQSFPIYSFGVRCARPSSK